MFHKKFFSMLLFIALLGLPSVAFSQVAPTGRTVEASSQLIFWYDNDRTTLDRGTQIQITNTSSTTPVEIHVQFYSSTGDGVDIANTVRCIEADFNDTLTANDTVAYNTFGPILLNDGSPAPVAGVDDTKGFVVVTPVVGSGDNTAISFQHMIGSTYVDDITIRDTHKINAMGRDAVNLATGQVLTTDGTTLDGVGTGFVVLQPSELSFNSASNPGTSTQDIVAIVFADEYGPAGLLGYRAVPGESSWSPFLFDFQEIPGSCPIITNSCFNNWGLTAVFPANDQLIDPAVNICNAVVLPADAQGATTSWTRSFINGLDPLESQIAVVNFTDTAIVPAAGADWANAK